MTEQWESEVEHYLLTYQCTLANAYTTMGNLSFVNDGPFSPDDLPRVDGLIKRILLDRNLELNGDPTITFITNYRSLTPSKAGEF